MAELLTATTLAAIVATFLLAGAVKGVIGLGLPIVSLGLLSALLDLPAAMVLMVVPSLVTNIWQALVGGHGRLLLRRLWPFLLAATASVWLGAMALTRVDVNLLLALLGLLLAVYALSGLLGLRIGIPSQREAWAGPLFGAANGVLSGMTGCFSVPGVMYLQAIGLSRDQLIQAMGMLFTLTALALGLALQSSQLVSAELGWVSLAAVLPSVLGMWLGQGIRRRLSEALFRRVFFSGILLLGFYIIAKAWLGGA